MERIGIDLGGTKIEGILLGGEGGGDLLRRERVATPREDYAGTVQAVRGLVERLETGRPGRATVGVGMPGALSPATGLVKNANSTWLLGRRLDTDLAAALGRPVRLANDANCFALSEARDGAGAGRQVVFGVILGTGTGGGIVVAGRVLPGANGITGEWGHNPLPWAEPGEIPGPPCWCGRSGCLETWLSGPGLSADLREHAGRDLDAEEIAAEAAAGDAQCAAALERHAGRLARGLAHVVNLLDPDLIVLGGGLSAMGHLYEKVPALWEPYIFSDRVETPLVPPVHGDAGGARGAAWLWDDSDGTGA